MICLLNQSKSAFPILSIEGGQFSSEIKLLLNIDRKHKYLNTNFPFPSLQCTEHESSRPSWGPHWQKVPVQSSVSRHYQSGRPKRRGDSLGPKLHSGGPASIGDGVVRHPSW